MRRRWPQHRHRAEGCKSLEHASRSVIPFSAWSRRVRQLVEAEVPLNIQHFVLDEAGLAADYANGMSVEDAAASRISDAASLA